MLRLYSAQPSWRRSRFAEAHARYVQFEYFHEARICPNDVQPRCGTSCGCNKPSLSYAIQLNSFLYFIPGAGYGFYRDHSNPPSRSLRRRRGRTWVLYDTMTTLQCCLSLLEVACPDVNHLPGAATADYHRQRAFPGLVLAFDIILDGRRSLTIGKVLADAPMKAMGYYEACWQELEKEQRV
jgi:hypothetical protein